MRPRRRKGPAEASQWLVAAGLLLALVAAQWLQQRVQRPSAPEGPLVGTPRLVDGDSFLMAGARVRLVGIDAPEGRQTCTRDGRDWPCGEESRRQLAKLIGGRPVTCTSHEKDQHDRLLAVCRVEGRDLNREMVLSGFALSYGRYGQEEATARSAKRGLWSGEFEPPKRWRQNHNRGGD